MGVGDDGEAIALREAGIAILEFPTVGPAALGPVEEDAVALQLGGSEVGGIGAYIGGEADGVAPLAGIIKALTVGLDCGVVGDAAFKTADGAVAPKREFYTSDEPGMFESVATPFLGEGLPSGTKHFTTDRYEVTV